MKCKEFGAALKAFADVLDVAGAPGGRDQVAMLAAVFDAHPALSVSDLTKRISAVSVAGSVGTPSLGGVACLLSALKNFLDKTAKSTMLVDVDAVDKLLRDRTSMEISTFVQMATEAASPHRPTRAREAPGLHHDLVSHYKERLEAALGDEEKFTVIYNDLRADTAIGRPEIIALANQMTGNGARTQDAALKKIWNRHQSLMLFKAKSRATGGRSAA